MAKDLIYKAARVLGVNMPLRHLTVFLYIFLASTLAFTQVDPELLDQETRSRISKVPEFAFIQKVAEELKVDIYLFGGTAAAFGHYVRWDLEREAGDNKYQPERFDYDYTNIYRGNQDLDIVVDGNKEQIAEVKNRLQAEYPHFEGSKESWDVRALRTKIGDRLPLLNNPDFINQHTDSNSIGMIKINSSANENSAYFSLLDWENPKSDFLIDIAGARVRYIFNPLHETTLMFLNDRNPPVLSAIRYLAKVTQYEVTPDLKDLDLVRSIVLKTNWSSLSSYSKYKLEKFSLKALLNAPDSEYASNILENSGFKKRLIQMDGLRLNETSSLSWWMNKEPLRSRQLGTSGRTGADLAKAFNLEQIVLSHETKSFEAYENITRSARGRANAFISRNGIRGETAAFGNGFYTKVGRRGAVGSGLTIRFLLNPEAREGTDFIVHGDYIIITNKNAITLIQENLNLTITAFLELILHNSITENDKGMLEKFRRKFQRDRSGGLKSQIELAKDFLIKKIPFLFKDEIVYLGETDVVGDYFRESLEESSTGMNSTKEPENTKERLSKLLKKDLSDIQTFDGLIAFVQTTYTDSLIYSYLFILLEKNIFETGDQEDHIKLIEYFITKGKSNVSIALLRNLLYKPEWAKYPHIIELILNKDFIFYKEVASLILVHKHWAKHTHLIDRIIENDMHADRPIFGRSENDPTALILSQSHWINNSDYIEKLIDENKAVHVIIEFVLSKKEWAQSQKGYDLLIRIMNINNHIYNAFIASHILTQKHWFKHAELADRILDSEIKYTKESKPSSNQRDNSHIVDEVLINTGWEDHPHLFIKAFQADIFVYKLGLAKVLKTPGWRKHPHLLEMFIDEYNNSEFLARSIHEIFEVETWADRPDFLFKFLLMLNSNLSSEQAGLRSEAKRLIEVFDKMTFKMTHWKNHSLLKSFLNGESLTVKNLVARHHEEDFFNYFNQKTQDPQIGSCMMILN